MAYITENEGGEGGEGSSNTSVGDIATYRSMMVKQALKRNNVFKVSLKEFDSHKTMTDEGISEKYSKRTPCVVTHGKKYLLISDV